MTSPIPQTKVLAPSSLPTDVPVKPQTPPAAVQSPAAVQNPSANIQESKAITTLPTPITPVANTLAPTPISDKLKPMAPGTVRKLKASDVGLTAPQNEAILAIRRASNLDLEKTLTDELKTAKAAMNAAMVDATAAIEIRKKFELVQRKTLELQKLKFERTLKIREVLSVEQRKILNELKNSH